MPARTYHLDRRAHDLIAQGDTGQPDDLLSTRQVCKWLRMSQQWAEIHRTKGGGPPFIRVSPTRIRYRRQSVLDWLAERTYASTAEYVQETGTGRRRLAEPATESREVVNQAPRERLPVRRITLRPEALEEYDFEHEYDTDSIRQRLIAARDDNAQKPTSERNGQ